MFVASYPVWCEFFAIVSILSGRAILSIDVTVVSNAAFIQPFLYAGIKDVAGQDVALLLNKSYHTIFSEPVNSTVGYMIQYSDPYSRYEALTWKLLGLDTEVVATKPMYVAKPSLIFGKDHKHMLDVTYSPAALINPGPWEKRYICSLAKRSVLK